VLLFVDILYIKLLNNSPPFKQIPVQVIFASKILYKKSNNFVLNGFSTQQANSRLAWTLLRGPVFKVSSTTYIRKGASEIIGGFFKNKFFYEV